MSGGDSYQTRVAAWFCTQILAEKIASTAWGLEAGETFEIVGCHTDNPVDDIYVETSHKRRFFINVKIKVDNEKSEKSDLASFADQAVRQFLQNQTQSKLNDRILLVTSSKSSPKIQVHLRNVLNQIRSNRYQSYLEIAKNNEEDSVLENFTNHAKIFWQRATNQTPNEGQIRRFLESIWIQILNVDKGESDEGNAQIILNSLLTEANKSGESAWKLLIEYCWELFKRSGIADREQLQNELSRLGIRLKAVPNFQEDIEKLKKLTLETLARFPEFTVIRVGENEIKIERPVKNILMVAAEDKSVIVTGDAGAGKSGVLYKFVKDLITSGREVVFLSVDRIEAISKTSFQADEKLEHDFDEILGQWNGDKAAFLVIDALDASRDPDKAKFLNSLIEGIMLRQKRWRVIVSIRRFDLRYNQTLKKSFAGSPPNDDYALREFSDLRHINISALSEDEWQQIPPQDNNFGALNDNANADLRKMLRLPFNLKLVGELFGKNIKLEELTPIHAQVELLEKYWQRRVLESDYDADALELLLAKAIETMVGKRRMQVNRRDLITETNSKTLRELLLQDILTEHITSNQRVDNSVLAFQHHVLFDYAVARLFLRGMANTLTERLERDRYLVLAIRPSILMHFQYELSRGEQFFWQEIFGIFGSEKIPSIGKLIGASVAVNSAKNIDFFEPLFEKLKSSNLKNRKIALQVLTHITNELRYRSDFREENPISKTTQAWVDFLEKLSEKLTWETAQQCRQILWNFILRTPTLNFDQGRTLGIVSRRLLDYALTLPGRNFILISSAITFVCQTFAIDPDSSIKSLRPILAAERVCEYGHKELNFFAKEIAHLSKIRPDFVAEIYQAAFVNIDLSEESTDMSFGPILRMSSTRRQDYVQMRLALRSEFGKFLEQSPFNATQSLIKIFDAYVETAYREILERRKLWAAITEIETGEEEANNRPTETFRFRNIDARIKSDYSEDWDDRSYFQDDEVLNLLGVFRNYLEKQSESGSEISDLILEFLVKNNQNAIFWRKIISCGKEFPDSFGRKIRSLAWTLPILINKSTHKIIGEYIKVNFPKFTDGERNLTEEAILSIPLSATDEIERENLTYLRNYLLDCLDEAYVINNEAREIISEIRRIDEERRQSFSYETNEFFPSPEILPVENEQPEGDKPPFEKDLLIPIKDFIKKHISSNPVLEEIKTLLPRTKDLYEILINPAGNDISESLVEEGWHYLSKFCADAVASDDIAQDADTFNFLKKVLLTAAEHPLPRPTDCVAPGEDMGDSSSYRFPFVRGNAGRGLVRIARFELDANDEKVLEQIENLTLQDPVGAVRCHTAELIGCLYKTAPELMWRTLNEICFNEGDLAVLEKVIKTSLSWLANQKPEIQKVFELDKTVLERIRTNENAGKVKKSCIDIFLRLSFLFEHKEAGEILDSYISKPTEYTSEIWQIANTAWNNTTNGIGESYDAKKERMRKLSFQILRNITFFSNSAFQTLYSSITEKHPEPPSEEEKKHLKFLRRIIEQIALKIYVASGAAKYHHGNSFDREMNVPETDEDRTTFWDEANETFDSLAEAGFADVTHRLVETLEFMLPYAPRKVFLIFGKAVKYGKHDDYQYDGMAVSHIVSMVEKVFGDYPDLLKDDPECQEAAIEVLDTFVEAGWESALRLTYQVNEIYR